MKKGITLLLATLFIFVGIDVVKADYNGTGGTSSAGTGSCTGFSTYCTYNNMWFSAVQLTLVYYDGTNWNKLGHSYYIINEEHLGFADALANDVGGYQYVEVNNNISTCGSASGPARPGCYYNVSWLRERYANNDNLALDKQAKTNVDNLFKAMGVGPADLQRPHNGEINFNSKGYRILIEPVMNFIPPYSSGGFVRLTIKEVYRLGGTSNNTQWASHSTLLTTERDDIGIYAHGMNQTSNSSEIADPRQGWGYNIINPHRSAIKQCYKLVLSSKNPKCTETNKQNTGWYAESFTSKGVSCDDKVNVVENATQYGRLVKTVNNNCKIYCTERVDVKYPGNVLPAIQTGGKFVWPTFGNRKDKGHNLDILGTRSCTVVGTGCGTSKVTVNDLYKDFKSSITLKFKQENYNDSIVLAKAEDTSTCNGCTGLYDQKKITVTHKVALKLPDKTYRYVNKQTTIASSTMTGAASNYTDIGYGNLPVSNNAKLEGNYNLEFANIDLGAKGIFSKLANTGANAPYKCTYKAKNTQNSCVCPPGTKNAGKDLWCFLSKNTDLNCPTAQQQYCNTDWNFNPDTCGGGNPDDYPSKYCDEPYQHISIESCVAAGNGYNACKARLCNSSGDSKTGTKYQCPKNTPNEFMDISWCVESLLAKGQTEASAIKVCQDIVCPANGIPIIYRTIDLRNPFPSKNLNGGIKGFNTDNISGRYPGANWNSKKLVDVEIRNNRGVADDAVYKKEPLYKFELNADTIRTIRQYNKNQARGAGYSDFTLNCEGTTVNAAGDTIKDGSKCFSYTFLRGTVASALKGGTCSHASVGTFDSCAS